MIDLPISNDFERTTIFFFYDEAMAVYSVLAVIPRLKYFVIFTTTDLLRDKQYELFLPL